MRHNTNYRNEQGVFAPYTLVIDGRKYVNPTAEMYARAGYLPYTPPEPTPEEIAERERQEEIERLKGELSESDYKVIKIAECLAVGEPSPYDAVALHAERQALRERIGQLEGGA